MSWSIVISCGAVGKRGGTKKGGQEIDSEKEVGKEKTFPLIGEGRQ